MKKFKVILEVGVSDTLGDFETDCTTVENAIKEKLNARYDGFRMELGDVDAREIYEEEG